MAAFVISVCNLCVKKTGPMACFVLSAIYALGKIVLPFQGQL